MRILVKQLKRLGGFVAVVATLAVPSVSVAAEVAVSVEPVWGETLIEVPARFYGLNIGLGTLRTEVPNRPLFERLKPDAVRIMTQRRVDSLKNRVITYPLSTGDQVYDWSELDTLIEYFDQSGAEVYLSLGFGPPDWLFQPSGGGKRTPPARENITTYSRYMADIVKRYAVEKKYRIRRVTVDNEPESVGYSYSDYFLLFNTARDAIKSVAPSVQVGGPVVGYSFWKQSDGSKSAFGASMQKFAQGVTSTDFVDWHVYTKSIKTVTGTVSSARAAFPVGKPFVISELNIDWRFTRDAVAESLRNNTSWDSVAWLSTLFDELPQLGVDQIFYFAWRARTFGLVNPELSEVRPNYYVFWAMTNLLGRHRVPVRVQSSNDIGVIATNDGESRRLFVYNKKNVDKTIEVVSKDRPVRRFLAFSQQWYFNHLTVSGSQAAFPQWVTQRATQRVTVPAGGFVVVEE